MKTIVVKNKMSAKTSHQLNIEFNNNVHSQNAFSKSSIISFSCGLFSLGACTVGSATSSLGAQ